MALKRGVSVYNRKTRVKGLFRTLTGMALGHALLATAYGAGLTIAVTVLDPVSRPSPGVRLELRRDKASAVIASRVTDAKGQAAFTDLDQRPYDLTISHDGFESIRREIDLTLGESAAVDVALIPTLTHKESVEVKGTADAVEQGSAPPVTLDGKTAKE